MYNMKKLAFYFCLIVLFYSLNSCIHDNFDEPPIKEIPEGKILNIAELRQMYVDSALLLGEASYKFEDDYSVFANVTMDDKTGNIYKAAFIQDYSGAINLRLQSSGGLYEGDSVRLYLKGTVLSAYNEMIQLDSVFVDKNIIKQATNKHVEPEVVSIGQIKTGNYQAKIVKLEDVQFIESDLGKSFSDPVTLQTMNRYIENCEGEQLIVRTSGYANFAGQTVPNGKGSLVAIISQFGNDWQLFIRDTDELVMEGNRCGDYNDLFSENFDDVENGQVFNLSGWKNINQIGEVLWKGVVTETLSAASINSDNNENVVWLITPQINVPSNAKLKFDTRAGNTVGSVLEVYISSDYDGGNSPQNFSWTKLDANIANSTSGFSSYVNSGNISLSEYTGNSYIAFKFVTQQGDTGQFFLDNFMIFED
jgi:hypothetical protein